MCILYLCLFHRIWKINLPMPFLTFYSSVRLSLLYFIFIIILIKSQTYWIGLMVKNVITTILFPRRKKVPYYIYHFHKCTVIKNKLSVFCLFFQLNSWSINFISVSLYCGKHLAWCLIHTGTITDIRHRILRVTRDLEII